MKDEYRAKGLNPSATGSRYKFVGFSERFANINVDVFHRVTRVDLEDDVADNESYLEQQIYHWSELNCTVHFADFTHEITPLIGSLAQVLYHKQKVVDTLVKHLTVKGSTALDALLSLTSTLAKDLRQSFYEFFPVILHTVANLIDPSDPNLLESVFTCLGYLFKFLQRQLLQDVEKAFLLQVPLLANRKPYIRQFAAESFAFLIRKLDRKGVRALLRLALNTEAQWRVKAHSAADDDNDDDDDDDAGDDEQTAKGQRRSWADLLDGLGQLFFFTIRGAKHGLHSRVSLVLPLYLDLMRDPSVRGDVAFHVVSAALSSACEHTNAQHSEPVVRCLVDDCRAAVNALLQDRDGRDEDDSDDDNDDDDVDGDDDEVTSGRPSLKQKQERLTSIVSLLKQWLTYRKGSRVPSLSLYIEAVDILLDARLLTNERVSIDQLRDIIDLFSDVVAFAASSSSAAVASSSASSPHIRVVKACSSHLRSLVAMMATVTATATASTPRRRKDAAADVTTSPSRRRATLQLLLAFFHRLIRVDSVGSVVLPYAVALCNECVHDNVLPVLEFLADGVFGTVTWHNGPVSAFFNTRAQRLSVKGALKAASSSSASAATPDRLTPLILQRLTELSTSGIPSVTGDDSRQSCTSMYALFCLGHLEVDVEALSSSLRGIDTMLARGGVPVTVASGATPSKKGKRRQSQAKAAATGATVPSVRSLALYRSVQFHASHRMRLSYKRATLKDATVLDAALALVKQHPSQLEVLVEVEAYLRVLSERLDQNDDGDSASAELLSSDQMVDLLSSLEENLSSQSSALRRTTLDLLCHFAPLLTESANDDDDDDGKDGKDDEEEVQSRCEVLHVCRSVANADLSKLQARNTGLSMSRLTEMVRHKGKLPQQYRRALAHFMFGCYRTRFQPLWASATETLSQLASLDFGLFWDVIGSEALAMAKDTTTAAVATASTDADAATTAAPAPSSAAVRGSYRKKKHYSHKAANQRERQMQLQRDRLDSLISLLDSEEHDDNNDDDDDDDDDDDVDMITADADPWEYLVRRYCDALSGDGSVAYQMTTARRSAGDKYDLPNEREGVHQLLWKAMGAVSTRVQKKRIGTVIDVFLEFYDTTYQEVTSERYVWAPNATSSSSSSSSSISRKAAHDRLVSYLDLFSQFKKPQAMPHTVRLRDAFMTLLAKTQPKVQFGALRCMFTWNEAGVAPHRVRLEQLMVDNTFGEALAALVINRDSEVNVIPDNHRAELIPILVHILHGKLLLRRGRAVKQTAKQRRSVILSYLGALDQVELSHFFVLILRPFDVLVSRDDVERAAALVQRNAKEGEEDKAMGTASEKKKANEAKRRMKEMALLCGPPAHIDPEVVLEIDAKKKKGFLNLLHDVVEHIGVTAEPYLHLFMSVMTHCLASTTASDILDDNDADNDDDDENDNDGDDDDTEVTAAPTESSYSRRNKADVRLLCMRRYAQVIDAYPDWPYLRQWLEPFFALTRDAVARLPSDALQRRVPSMLEVLRVLSHYPTMIPEVIERSEVFTAVARALGNPKASSPSVSAALSVVENILRLQLDQVQQEQDVDTINRVAEGKMNNRMRQLQKKIDRQAVESKDSTVASLTVTDDQVTELLSGLSMLVTVPFVEKRTDTYVARFSAKAKKNRAAEQKPRIRYAGRVLALLSCLSMYATDVDAADRLVATLLQFLGKMRTANSDTKCQVMKTVTHLVRLVSEPSHMIPFLSQQLLGMDGSAARCGLSAVFAAVGQRDASLADVAHMITDMNSFSSDAQEKNYERRMAVYTDLTAGGFKDLTREQLLPVVCQCLYDIGEKEMSIRGSSSTVLQGVVEHVASTTDAAAAATLTKAVDGDDDGDDDDDEDDNDDEEAEEDDDDDVEEGSVIVRPSTTIVATTAGIPSGASLLASLGGRAAGTTMYSIVSRIVSPAVRRGLRSKVVEVRREYLTLLGLMARLDAYETLYGPLRPLYSKEPDADFFEGISHLQMHRRANALHKLNAISAKTPLPPRLAKGVILPLLTITLNDLTRPPRVVVGSGGAKKRAKRGGSNRNRKGNSNLESKTDVEGLVVEEVRNSVVAMATAFQWPDYFSLLRHFLRLLKDSKPRLEHVMVRIFCGIVDGCHFSMDSPQTADRMVEEVRKKRAGLEITFDAATTGVADADADGDDKGDGDDDDDDDDANTREGKKRIRAKQKEKELRQQRERREEMKKKAEDDNNNNNNTGEEEEGGLQTKVLRAFVEIVLPALLERLVDKHSQEVVQVNVALAVVKILKLLPSALLQIHVPHLVGKITAQLRSREGDTRDATRVALADVTEALGPNFFAYTVKELISGLTKGFQVHVLGFTVHSLLYKVLPTFTRGALDYCTPMLADMLLEDTVTGEAVKKRQIQAIAQATKEAGKCKSFDSYEILGRHCTFPKAVNQLIVPVIETLTSTVASTREVVDALEKILARVGAGIHRNDSVNVASFLIFTHDLIDRALQRPEVKTRTITRKTAGDIGLESCLVRATPKSEREAAKDHFQSNFASSVGEFALTLLYQFLRRGSMFDPKDIQHLQMLDPYVELLLRCLRSRSARVIGGALKCLSVILYYRGLPSLDTKATDLSYRIFSILKNATPESPLVRACLKCLAVIIRDCPQCSPNERQLKLLLQFALNDLDQLQNHTVTFGLIKAIIARKLVVNEVYDLAERVAELMLEAQLPQVRAQCSQVLLQFMLHFPMGKKRLKKHVDFIVKNLAFPYEEGREAVVDFLHAVITKFPQPVLHEFAEYFFVSLVARLVNDTSPSCREMCGTSIRALYASVDATHQSSMRTLVLTWYGGGEGTSPSIARAASQVLGLMIEATITAAAEKSGGKSVARRKKLISLALPLMRARLDDVIAHDTRVNMVEEDEDDVVDTEASDLSQCEWQIAYYTLNAVSKLIQPLPQADDDDSSSPQHVIDPLSPDISFVWPRAAALLLHAHSWVRLSASRLLGSYFGQWQSTPHKKFARMVKGSEEKMAVAAAQGDEDEVEAAGVFILQRGRLFDLGRIFSRQLSSAHLSPSLADQVVKNLFFVTSILFRHPSLCLTPHRDIFESHRSDRQAFNGDNGDGDGGDGDNDEQGGEANGAQESNLLWHIHWVVRRLSFIARRGHAVNQIAVFKFFAAMSSQLSEKQLRPFLMPILAPMYRAAENTDKRDEEVRALATDVLEIIKKRAGHNAFFKVYQEIRETVVEKRMKRKRAMKLETVLDPELAARKRIKKNLLKKQSKKRKFRKGREEIAVSAATDAARGGAGPGTVAPRMASFDAKRIRITHGVHTNVDGVDMF